MVVTFLIVIFVSVVSLERAVMAGVVTGKRDRERPERRWIQDIKCTLGVRVHDAGGQATSQDSFE